MFENCLDNRAKTLAYYQSLSKTMFEIVESTAKLHLPHSSTSSTSDFSVPAAPPAPPPSALLPPVHPIPPSPNLRQTTLSILTLGKFKTSVSEATLSSSISLLYRFCCASARDISVFTTRKFVILFSLLFFSSFCDSFYHSFNFTFTRSLALVLPVFNHTYTSVLLPSHVPPQYRKVDLPPGWDAGGKLGKKKARKGMLCLLAVARLYETGVLNERLLPLKGADFEKAKVSTCIFSFHNPFFFFFFLNTIFFFDKKQELLPPLPPFLPPPTKLEKGCPDPPPRDIPKIKGMCPLFFPLFLLRLFTSLVPNLL